MQDNWKAGNRLTLDYGVRFYYLTPQWDTTLQASNFLPDEFDASAAQAVSPVCSARIRARATIGAAWIRRSSDRGADAGQHGRDRFIGRLVPGSDRFNGAFQAGQGINDQLQDGTAFKISPRVGFVYDLTGQGRDDRPRRLGHLLRSPAGQHGVRHDCQRARRAELHAAVGPLQDLDGGRRRSGPDARAEPDRLRLHSAAGRRSGTSACSEAVQELHVRPRVRGVEVGGPAAPGRRSTRCRAARRSCPRTRTRRARRARRRARRRCRTTCCGPTRATAPSGCGATAATRTTTRCRPA